MHKLLPVLSAIVVSAAFGGMYDQPYALVERGMTSDARKEVTLAITSVDGQTVRDLRRTDPLTPGKHTNQRSFPEHALHVPPGVDTGLALSRDVERSSPDQAQLVEAGHSTTRSACIRIVCGTDTPRRLATFWFTMSSNLVGCSTGNSPGLAPLRSLSTYRAASRPS